MPSIKKKIKQNKNWP